MKKQLFFVSLALLMNSFVCNVKAKTVTKPIPKQIKQSKQNQPLRKLKVAKIEVSQELNFNQIMADLSYAEKNNEIDAILLMIDNYGGSVARFSALHDMVKAITKPVISLVTAAASGGYLIACASDCIISSSMSIIGSIGVYQEVASYSNTKIENPAGLRADVEVQIISAGKFKACENPHFKSNKEHKQYLQEGIDNTYKQFINMVANDRNIKLADSDKWAEGKVFTGSEALSLGLIDYVGTLFKAEDEIFNRVSKNKPECRFDKNNMEFICLGSLAQTPAVKTV